MKWPFINRKLVESEEYKPSQREQDLETQLEIVRRERDNLARDRDRVVTAYRNNDTALRAALAEHSILQSNLHQTHHGPFAPEWEAKDAALLRSFLISPTGQRLQRLADYYEQKANRQAAHAPADRDHGAGIARGWYECIEWLCKTLPVFIPPKEDDQTTEERKGDSAIRERLSP